MTRSVKLSLGPGLAFCDMPAPAKGVRCLLSLKLAGDMSLKQQARRRAFFLSLGIEPRRVLALRQVHSHRVITEGELSGPAGARDDRADGLLAADPAAVLTVTVADCLPIFVADRRTGARGLVHSGWKGTGIVAEAVERMRALYGSRPSDLSVLIGPGIGSCCYDVSRERYELFRRRFGADAGIERDGRVYLDLRRANLALLAGLGVDDVTVVEDCTACTPELASYRILGNDGYVGMVAVMGSF